MKVLAVFAESGNWPRVYTAVNVLLEYGVPVLWSTKELEISGKKLPAGTFIFPMDQVFDAKVPDDSLQTMAALSEQEIERYLNSENIAIFKEELREPVDAYLLSPSRVAVYADSGGYNHASVVAASGFDVEFINGREIVSGALERFSILMSGGGGRWRKAGIYNENVLLTALSEEGAKTVSDFVKKGERTLDVVADHTSPVL